MGVLNQVAVHDQINDHVTKELPLNTPPPVLTTYKHCIHFFQQTPLSGHL